MRSISALGVRSVRRSVGRYVLTAVGATLGVAVFFGILATNASIEAGLNRALGSQRSSSVVIAPIGSYGNTLPTSMLDQVGGMPDVALAAATVWLNGKVAGTETVLDIYGQRWVDGPARSQIDTPRRGEDFDFEGRLPAAGADEVSISETRATELGLALGDTVEVVTRSGPVKLTVVRIADVGDAAGLLSMETALRLQGQGDGVQSLWVRLADGASTTAWAAQHGPALDNARVEPGGGESLRNTVTVLQNAFSALGVMAAFVGGFLIYLTLSTSVAERARTWGVLRAVGGDRLDVVRAVLAEALVLGAIATTAGIVVGLGLGTALLGFSQALYDIPRSGLTVRPGTVVAAIAMGMLVPPLAALVPAWRAAKAEPVDAMRERHVDTTRLGRAWIAGVVLLATALVINRVSPTGGTLRLAPVLFLFGAVLTVPVVIGPLARLVGLLATRLSPGLGDAAVKHLVRERNRSSYTLGLIMVVLGLILAIGAMQTSITSAIHDAFRIRYAADVTVWAWNGMPDDMAAQLAGVEGVARSTPFRSGRVGIGTDNSMVELVVIEPSSFFAMQGFPWTDGDDESAEAALTAGGSVLVPEVFAAREGLSRGEAVTLETTEGPRELTIAGVYTTPERGVRIIVGAVDGERLFNAGPITGFEMQAADGVTAEQLVERVEAVIGERPGYFANTMDGEEQTAAAEVQRTFQPFLAVTLLAGIVGILGLANTLGMAIMRRTREIGVLRAVGIERRALGRMVLVEALTLTGVAFVLSLPLGWVLASALLRSSSSALGFLVALRPPLGMFPTLAITVVVIAAIATVGPARRIARLDPVVALRFD